jgi:hypothetical protein
VSEPVRVLEIEWSDPSNAFRVNVARIDSLAEGQRGQQRQFRPRIVAIDIGARIGFRIPEPLRFASTSSKGVPCRSISVRM